MNNTCEKLITLFKEWSKEEVQHTQLLPLSGSNRVYYRIYSDNQQVIGTYNADRKENTAFFYLTNHFRKYGLSVPEILSKNEKEGLYLQKDLGKETLFDILKSIPAKKRFHTKSILELYRKTIDQLLQFQILASRDIDFSYCYPRPAFDSQSIQWDLNYFKYYFLRLAKIQFYEEDLENDFRTLIDFLLSAPQNFFLYRDMQSRNIMIRKNEPYFIDYQGGRKGALHYDIASLLYDGKTGMPEDIREELLAYYISRGNDFIPLNTLNFKHYFYAYALLRVMQALGAYGFRGFYEKRIHFLQSIPFGIENLGNILKKMDIPVKLPMLSNTFQQIISSKELTFKNKQKNALHVRIYSFSYKNKIPQDTSEHGGGHVFDCRALPNPGRNEKYRTLTGKDAEVILFLKNEKAVEDFMANVFQIAEQSVNTYITRNFEHLMISFGCTGGQHRSVYCAEILKGFLEEKYNIHVSIHHQELQNL